MIPKYTVCVAESWLRTRRKEGSSREKRNKKKKKDTYLDISVDPSNTLSLSARHTNSCPKLVSILINCLTSRDLYLGKPKFHPDWFFKLSLTLRSSDDIHNASSYLLIATVEKYIINMLLSCKRSVQIKVFITAVSHDTINTHVASFIAVNESNIIHTTLPSSNERK